MTAEKWGLLRFHRESRRYMAGCSWWLHGWIVERKDRG